MNVQRPHAPATDKQIAYAKRLAIEAFAKGYALPWHVETSRMGHGLKRGEASALIEILADAKARGWKRGDEARDEDRDWSERVKAGEVERVEVPASVAVRLFGTLGTRERWGL